MGIEIIGLAAPFTNAGKIPVEQSAFNALMQWANDCERRLARVGCGTVLDRTRHREWAARRMADAVIVEREWTAPDGSKLVWQDVCTPTKEPRHDV